jgi:hypothetical protein
VLPVSSAARVDRSPAYTIVNKAILGIGCMALLA